MTDNDYKNLGNSKWETFPVDCVCDLLREQPQLIASCPDSVWRKFRLGHWAKLIREQTPGSNYPVIATHEGRWAVVYKMKELGVAVGVAGSNDAVGVGGFEWCCLFHWAEEYGSVFHRFAAAIPKEEKIKYIAENSAMNPQGGVLGHRSRFGTDIPKHIQWLAAMAADFAAMAAEAAVSAPEYAEEYAIIAQAAAYETKVLMPEVQTSDSIFNGSGCCHSQTGKNAK